MFSRLKLDMTCGANKGHQSCFCLKHGGLPWVIFAYLCNQLKIFGEDDQLNLDDGMQAGCVDRMCSSQFPSVPKNIETLATLDVLWVFCYFFGM